MKIQKEKIFEDVLKSTFKIIYERKVQSLEPHFIFAGEYYSKYDHGNIDRLKRFIQTQMKIYQIRSVMATTIFLKNDSLITQEKVESYSNGENSTRQISVNDDLERFFEDLQLGQNPSLSVQTYYLPKLTEDKMALVDSKDANFFSTLSNKVNPDVPKKEMDLSLSDSKFILGKCVRRTFRIRTHVKSSHVEPSSTSCCLLQ